MRHAFTDADKNSVPAVICSPPTITHLKHLHHPAYTKVLQWPSGLDLGRHTGRNRGGIGDGIGWEVASIPPDSAPDSAPIPPDSARFRPNPNMKANAEPLFYLRNP